MNINYKNIVIIIFLLIVSGCGYWSNFKTYFNTYYNALEIFTEAESEVKDLRKDLFGFEELKITSNTSKKFDNVIKKTSAIMQYNKDSDYFEDALLMTGKSFYYQQNYSRALRKFAELELIPDSKLSLENKLWIGKSHLQLRETEKALEELDNVKKIALEENEQEIIEEAYKAKIGYFLYDKDYQSSTEEIKKFLETDISDELRAEVLYELGALYVKLEDFKEAEKALAFVQDYSPTPETEFKSRFELAKIQKKFGNLENSLELLDELRDEGKFADNLDKINLEIGKINYEKGNIELALDSFTDVDTTFTKTEAGGIAGFYRAEIIEKYIHDYDSSLVLYKKTISSPASVEYKDKAKSKAVLLDKYINLRKELARLDRDFQYLTNEERFIKDSLDYVQQVKLDSAKTASGSNQNVRGGTRNTKTTITSKLIKPARPKISVDSIHALNSKQYFELANLFFTELNYPDSAYIYYNLSLNEKEENPNQAQTYYAIGSYYLTINEKAKADSMFNLVFEKFPFNRLRNEAAKHLGKPLYDFDKDPVEEEYTAAEEMFNNSDYKNALKNLFKIYRKHPNSIFASKSLYTIGFILENKLNLPDSAASIYDTLNTKYKTTEYAKSIQIKLNGYKDSKVDKKDHTEKKAAVKDSIKTQQVDIKSDDGRIIENEIVSDNVESDKEETDNVEVIEEKNDLKNNEAVNSNENKINDKEINDNEVTEVVNEKVDSITTNSFDISNIPVISRDIYKNDKLYYVQISSWQSEKIAKSEVDKLKEQNHNAFFVKTFVDNLSKIYFRVLIGPFNSFMEAKKVRMKFNKY